MTIGSAYGTWQGREGSCCEDRVYWEVLRDVCLVDFPGTVRTDTVPSLMPKLKASGAKVFAARDNAHCHILPLVWDGVSPVIHVDDHPDIFGGRAESSKGYLGLCGSFDYCSHVSYAGERRDVFWVYSTLDSEEQHPNEQLGLIHFSPSGKCERGRSIIRARYKGAMPLEDIVGYIKAHSRGSYHLHVDTDFFSDGPHNAIDSRGQMDIGEFCNFIPNFEISAMSVASDDILTIEALRESVGL